MRHYLNLGIIYSLFNEFRTVGPFELDWATEQYKCWISQYITIILLSLLQALNLFWLFLIIRIAYRFVFYNIVKDERSDDESEPEEEQLVEKAPMAINGAAANGHASNGTAKVNGAAKK